MTNIFRRASAKKLRSQKGASEIAQFIPVLYIVFLIVFLPLINLGSVFIAAAVQYLATNEFASKASTQTNYDAALNSMVSEAARFQNFGLAKLIAMVPQGGYVGCGDDLFVVTTDTASGAVTTSPADQPLNNAVNTKSNMYELSVKSSYCVSPLINLSAVPIIGEVPGVGQPVNLTFSANRPVEHPSGLQAINGNSQNGAGSLPLFARTAGNGLAMPSPSNITWRNPTIFQQIQAAGQTVVSVNVIVVAANNPNWTQAGVTLSPGQHMWLDTQAVGQWVFGPPAQYPLTDANGNVGSLAQYDIAPPLNTGSLIGAFRPSGTPFEVGDTLVNYSPQGVGQFAMIMNDGEANNGFADNVGVQLVRVIITQ